MVFEFKDKNFPVQTKLTAKEIETYCSIYNKEYHEIKFYSDDQCASLSPYELFVFHKRFLDYIFPKGWNVKDELLCTHIDDVKTELKNIQDKYGLETEQYKYKLNEYLDFLFTLIVTTTGVIARPIAGSRNYAILIKEKFLEEFVTIKEKTYHLLEKIVLNDDFTSVLPISKMDFTDAEECGGAIMLFLYEYFNLEKLIKEDLADNKLFEHYISCHYNLALTRLLMFYIYKHDLYNKKIDIKDHNFYRLDFTSSPYDNGLTELWFKNLAPRLSE